MACNSSGGTNEGPLGAKMKLLILSLFFAINAQAETTAQGAVETALASEFAQVKINAKKVEVSEIPYDFSENVRAQYFVYSEEPGWNLPWDTELNSYSVVIVTDSKSLNCAALVGRDGGYVDFVRLSCPGLGVVSEVMIQRSQGTLPARLL